MTKIIIVKEIEFFMEIFYFLQLSQLKCIIAII